MDEWVEVDHNEGYIVRDSGERKEFSSGMVRDTDKNKPQYHRCLEGPMFKRWAEHLAKGAVKYPDNPDGTANWTRASGSAELIRFKQSALRHFIQWYYGEADEDHAAAVFFNINGVEYVRNKTTQETPESLPYYTMEGDRLVPRYRKESE